MKIIMQFDEDGDCWIKRDTDKHFQKWEHPLEFMYLIEGEDFLGNISYVIEDYTVRRLVDGTYEDVKME